MQGVARHVVGHQADVADLCGVDACQHVVGGIARVNRRCNGGLYLGVVDPLVFAFTKVGQGNDVTGVEGGRVGVGDPYLNAGDVDA